VLLINILQNYYDLGMVTPFTGSRDIVLFAGAATLWTIRVAEYVFLLVVNIGMAITNFIILSLPVVGTGLYEVYSLHCTVLIDAKNVGGCNRTAVQDVFGGVESASFMCAQQGAMLGFDASPGFLPLFVDWSWMWF
jgi:hypothetical protein